MITYYKLPEEFYYNKDDKTKDTSLTGLEIDKNFNFLEGRDIKSIEVSEDKKDVVISFLDGTTRKCPNTFNNLADSLNFEYDEETGVLSVYVNDDEEAIEVEGFLTLGDIANYLEKHHVVTDNTLTGCGTSYSPLSISRSHRTGTVRPIDYIVGDTSQLPENPTVGCRCITFEEVNTVGKYYNFWGLNDVMEALEEEDNGWHVPSKPEWDALLDAMEPDPEYRNHWKMDDSCALGNMANKMLADEASGFEMNYCGYANKDEEMHVSYKGTQVYFWTNSTKYKGKLIPVSEDSRNAYTKGFWKGAFGVYQNITDNTRFCSIRLVKECGEDENVSAARILGTTYPVTIMRSIDGKNRMWTTVNLDYDTENDNTFTDEQSGYVTKVFVNEWDGTRWIKSTIDDGITFFYKYDKVMCYVAGDDVIPVSDLSNMTISEDIPIYGIGQIGGYHDGDTITAGTSILDILKNMFQNKIGAIVNPLDEPVVNINGINEYYDAGIGLSLNDITVTVEGGSYVSADPTLYKDLKGFDVEQEIDVDCDDNGVLNAKCYIDQDSVVITENEGVITVECDIYSKVKPYMNNGEFDTEHWINGLHITKTINPTGNYQYFYGYCKQNYNGEHTKRDYSQLFTYNNEPWGEWQIDYALTHPSNDLTLYTDWCSLDGATMVGETGVMSATDENKPNFVVILPEGYYITSTKAGDDYLSDEDLERLWGIDIPLENWSVNYRRYNQKINYHNTNYYVFVLEPEDNTTYSDIIFNVI